MTLRPCQPADHPALIAFLRQHVTTSMFPLTNLLGTGQPTQSWVVAFDARITGYLGLGANGNLMPQWPDGDWPAARPLLAGQPVSGVVGPAEQCGPLLAALGLADVPRTVSEVEPGMTLTLSALNMPDCAGFHLAPLSPSELPMVTDWRSHYNIEVLGMDAATAATRAKADVPRMIAAGRHRMLWKGTDPVATAGLNAALPDCVQVGAVYTPPPLRRQGFARRAVALLLDEQRKAGVETAVLFAAAPHAMRAYRAIGFQPSHSFGLHLFANAATVSWP